MSRCAVRGRAVTPFNDYNNKHESDWEMVQLEFAASSPAEAMNQEPLELAYSQHEGAEVSDWHDDKLEIVDGTHPVVYAAAGSHANYYESALYLGRSGQQGFGCDDTTGAARSPAGCEGHTGAGVPVGRLPRPLGSAGEGLLQRSDRTERQGPVDCTDQLAA